MTLLGQGAMVAWHDLLDGADADHDDWHSHEHMEERVRIAGFRRGRRCRSLAGPPELFIMYEVDDLAVLTSDAYQQRLNAPTEWTRRIVPNVQNMTRTLCEVLASHGQGVGAFVLTFRFGCEAEQRTVLIEQLSQQLAPNLVKRQGVVATHLLQGDPVASGVTTDEMRMRGGADKVADLVLVVEGYDAAILGKLQQATLTTLLEQYGARDIQPAIHHLAHLVGEHDL